MFSFQLYTSDYNRSANCYDFKKSLDLLQYIDKVPMTVWVKRSLILTNLCNCEASFFLCDLCSKTYLGNLLVASCVVCAIALCTYDARRNARRVECESFPLSHCPCGCRRTRTLTTTCCCCTSGARRSCATAGATSAPTTRWRAARTPSSSRPWSSPTPKVEVVQLCWPEPQKCC